MNSWVERSNIAVKTEAPYCVKSSNLKQHEEIGNGRTSNSTIFAEKGVLFFCDGQYAFML